ncbi:MAG TPA: type I-F CRISPR-associated protein Csy2, partial [Agitococcus sp.]|nr:type I-F CRISPR-associated protein Csy2 [Agitococcus sp.]
MRRFLLIPHIKIHNANAMSSPYTIGFPAMTAWLGAVHALQRYVQQQG